MTRTNRECITFILQRDRLNFHLKSGRDTLCRSYSVMVITKDSESFDPGSSPGRTSRIFLVFALFYLNTHFTHVP